MRSTSTLRPISNSEAFEENEIHAECFAGIKLTHLYIYGEVMVIIAPQLKASNRLGQKAVNF